MDHLYKLPAMLRQLDGLAKSQNRCRTIEIISRIIEEYMKIIASLQTLYGVFESSISGPLYWSELSTLESPLDDPISGKLFPVSFYFPSFSVAQLITTYWTAVMVCHLHLMHIYNKLAKAKSLLSKDSMLDLQSAGHKLSSADSLHLLAQENSEKWSGMARNICQSIRYYTQDEMGGLGLITALSMLYSCHSCMDNVPEQWTREMGWVVDFIKQVEGKLDFPVGRVLLGE
jgi:hypothetical protein